MNETSFRQILIKTDGYCIQQFIKRLKVHNMGEEDVKKLVSTAVEVVQNSVNVYTEKFGEGDVGSNGIGSVSNPYNGKEVPPDTTGLIYGRVQSGKTNTTIASLAIAQENGFKCFIVLTSDNTWLGKQTASRFNNQLEGGPVVFDWEQWKNDPNDFAKTKLSTYLKDTGVVLVSTKNSHHLENLIKVLKLSKVREVPTLIFDDEADNASLDTNESKKFKDGKYLGPSKIFDQISKIRIEVPNHIFIQITATPQSLLLQQLDHPCKPRFCAAIPEPGTNYMGGELFFTDNSDYCYKVESEEIKQLKKQEKNKMNPGDNWDIPNGLKLALCCFFLGAVYKMQSDEINAKYSFLAHICYKKDNHKNLEKIISSFVQELDQALRGRISDTKEKEAKDLLYKACQELTKTSKDLPFLDVLIDQLKYKLRQAIPKVINANNPEKEPKYDPGMNILIGGNRLGRGVTIEGLIVTYYGREAKQRMMDTVHQHARMYGYRPNLKDVTRLFLPGEILEDFKSIHETDENMRQAIGDDPKNIKSKLIWVGEKLKPTRSQVLNLAYIDCFEPGKAVLPSYPLWKSNDVRNNTAILDKILSPYNNDNEYYEVTIDFLIEVLRYIPSKPCPGKKWEDKRIEEALKNLKSAAQKTLKENDIAKGILNVRRGKKGDGLDLSNQQQKDNQQKNKPWVGAFAQSAWISEPKKKYPKLPILVIMYQKGDKKNYWDDQPFYLPTLIFPQNEFVLMFNSSEEQELESDNLEVLDDDSEN